LVIFGEWYVDNLKQCKQYISHKLSCVYAHIIQSNYKSMHLNTALAGWLVG